MIDLQLHMVMVVVVRTAAKYVVICTVLASVMCHGALHVLHKAHLAQNPLTTNLAQNALAGNIPGSSTLALVD